MKTNLTKFFTTVTVAATLIVSVSYVSAYSPDIVVPNIFKTDTTQQTKTGGLMSEMFLATDLGFFTKALFPGKDSWLNIGGETPTFNTGGQNISVTSAGGTIPLVAHINGRNTKTQSGINGIDATRFIVNGQCGPVGIVNDRASSFDFISTTNGGGYADLIAGQLSLSGGAPSNNSVLAAVDNNGNAVWAKLIIQNGQVVVIENETGSPVESDSICPN
jgi:hypothetical protein